jgi:tetratricopeptide (TPR) repeat protein
MRIFCSAVALAASWLTSPGYAQAGDRPNPRPVSQTQASADKCADKFAKDDVRIAACTSIIAAGNLKPADLAAAYSGRCEARVGARDREASKSKAAEIENLALEDCTRAIALKDDNGRVRRQRGLIYSQRNDFKHAIADYDRAVALRPDDYFALSLRGIAYSAIGDYDHAIADCNLALPHDIGGFAALCLKDAKASKAEIEAGQKPGDARAWCDGKALAQEGDKDKRQIEGCTRLIDSKKETQPDLIKDYFNRARVEGLARDDDKAILDYQSVIKLKPDYAEAYGWLGFIYWERNQYSQAIPNFDRAIALNAHDLDYLEERGLSYSALGQYASAIKDFDLAMKHNPFNRAQYYVDRSVADNGLHDYDGAIADAGQAIKLSRTSEATEGYERRGEARFHKDDFGGAITDFDHALQLYPEYAEALFGRGVAKLKKGDRAGGETDVSAARKLNANIAAEEAKTGITP